MTIQLDAEPAWETDFDDRGTWLVQNGEPGKTVDYGVVSDGHGFEDSPDSERISGGINSKGPYAVAIGRQANMLQWGFYAAPDRMTESAKTVFLNSIVYMKQFDGRRPLVEKRMRSRNWFEQFADGVAKYSGEGADKDGVLSYYLGRFPEAARKEAGADADKLRAWYRANAEYIHGDGRSGWQLDEDLRKLELSNRKPEFLDWLTAHLDGEHREVAQRLAARYLPEDVPAAGAADWIRANRKFLFFSDQGGYRWFVDVDAKAAAGER